MKILLNVVVWIVLVDQSCCNADLEDTAQRLRTLLEDHFSDIRHSEANPENKENAFNFIKATLEEYEYDVQTMAFSGTRNENSYEGTNIIAVLQGNTNPAEDEVVLLGAHYDTVATTPGVDDNGSGMAVLLDSARMLQYEMCKPINTIVLVAFDLEEAGLFGSHHFANDWLPGFLANEDGTNRTFAGAIVLETLLNYNSTHNSQEMPHGFNSAFPDLYAKMEAKNFTGDFLAVIGRSADEAELISEFGEHWSNVGNTKYSVENIELPFSGVPSEQDLIMYQDLFRSDHTSFWNHEPNSYKAIFVTDSADFRGTMQQCYHQACDNIESIDDDDILFLAKSTRAITDMIKVLAGDEEPNGCKETATASMYYPSQSLFVIVLFGLSVSFS